MTNDPVAETFDNIACPGFVDGCDNLLYQLLWVGWHSDTEVESAIDPHSGDKQLLLQLCGFVILSWCQKKNHVASHPQVVICDVFGVAERSLPVGKMCQDFQLTVFGQNGQSHLIIQKLLGEF